MESFEFHGVWWLPTDPDNKVLGVLKFDPTQKPQLILFGSFKIKENIQTITYDSMQYTNVILGETSSNVFTLLKCWEVELGFKRSVFNIDFIFKGKHFLDEESIVFDNITLNYPNLSKWANVPGICLNVSKEANVNGPNEYYYFRKPKAIKSKLKGFEINILFKQVSLPQIPNELHLIQFASIEIKFSNKTHFHECKNKWETLTNFLTFGMGNSIYPTRIVGKLDPNKEIEIFYDVNSLISPIDDISQENMLFLFSDISNEFEKCLNNWFDNADKLEPTYDLYFGTHALPSMFLEHQFLSYIQAIESYHSRIYPTKGRVYLRNRLERIFSENGELLKILIGNDEEFIDAVVKTRNYYTHYDGKLEKKAVTDDNLIILTDKLKYTLEICLMLILGINKEKIKTIIDNNKDYKFLKDRIKNQNVSHEK